MALVKTKVKRNGKAVAVDITPVVVVLAVVNVNCVQTFLHLILQRCHHQLHIKIKVLLLIDLDQQCLYGFYESLYTIICVLRMRGHFGANDADILAHVAGHNFVYVLESDLRELLRVVEPVIHFDLLVLVTTILLLKFDTELPELVKQLLFLF